MERFLQIQHKKNQHPPVPAVPNNPRKIQSVLVHPVILQQSNTNFASNHNSQYLIFDNLSNVDDQHGRNCRHNHTTNCQKKLERAVILKATLKRHSSKRNTYNQHIKQHTDNSRYTQIKQQHQRWKKFRIEFLFYSKTQSYEKLVRTQML